MTTTIRHIGTMDAVPAMIALDAAGVLASTHTVLTWHDRSEIRAARKNGRIDARFVVRYGDPDCYVVRRES